VPEADLHYLTLTELSARFDARELSPVEVTEALLERIERLEGRLRAWVRVLPETALAQARQAEREITAGAQRGPLHGVPIGVKDLCAIRGVPTTCDTRVLADWIPDHDATVVERLVQAGAVILGKLQLTEGAYATHHPDIAPPVNPWDETRWTGVSSSGSAVATAAGLCYGSLGTDTGGSIRFPSACCGLVGIKPTYGRVSRHGVFPLAASLDHVGPIARCTADAAALLGAIAGWDPSDPTSRPEPVPDCLASLDQGIAGVRIGVDEDYCTRSVHPEVSSAVLAAAGVLRDCGAEIRQISVPDVEEIIRGWMPVTTAEAAVAHQKTFPARADDYGPAFREFLEGGLRVTGLEYAKAHHERLTWSGRLAEVFQAVDLILCPSVITPPLSTELLNRVALDSEARVVAMKFTAPYDFSGSPTISIPCGFSSEGLPLSLQLVARHLEEPLLCRAGHAFEHATEWHARHPALEEAVERRP